MASEESKSKSKFVEKKIQNFISQLQCALCYQLARQFPSKTKDTYINFF